MSTLTDMVPHGVNAGAVPTMSVLMQVLIMKYFTPYYSFCTIGKDFLEDVRLSRILLSVDDQLQVNLRNAIEEGCQAFVVDEPGVGMFLDLFIPLHDTAMQRSLDKKVILLVTQQNRAKMFDHLISSVVLRELPNVLIIVYNDEALPISLHTMDIRFPDVRQRTFSVSIEQISIDWNEWETQSYFPDKASNLQGYVLRVSTCNYLPFSGYERVPVGAGNAYDPETGERSIWVDGTELQLLVSFCDRRNCSILVFPEDEDEWGVLYPNGTGTGLMGSVAERRTDIAFAAFYLWFQPYNFSSYTATISRSGVTVLVPKPSMLAFWRTPFLSFSRPLWGAVMVTFFSGIIAAWIAGKVRYRLLSTSEMYDHNRDLMAEKLTVSDAVLIMVSFFVAQSSNVRNDLWSCIFLFASLLLAGFMVSKLYSAGLASIMTVPQYEKSIDTVRDFAASGMQWYGPTPYCLEEIWHAAEPHLQQIQKTYTAASAEEMSRHAHVGSSGFIIEEAQHGNFAPSDFLDRETSTTLQPLKDFVYTQNCAALITNTNPLRANLNEFILRVQQSGILYHLGTMAAIRYLPTDVFRNIESSRWHHHDEGAVTLKIGHFLGAFFILGYGLLCAGLVFVGELWGTMIIRRMKQLSAEMKYP